MFEGAQRKELQILEGVEETFAKWTREEDVSKWQEYNAYSFYYFCESPAPREVVGQA